MKIGTIDLGEKPVLLAPMEDVTDASFRLLCREFGAAMVYSEFISADALVRGIPSTERKLTIRSDERPIAIQIYGRDAATMADAARLVEDAGADMIDINFGCPVKRIASKGAGAGLLQNIPLLLEITCAVVQAVQLPVTVKTRLGWDHDHILIYELAQELEACGIAALTIHGRTRSQMYRGEARWDEIRRVVENPHRRIPIIGNGDITSGNVAQRRFSESGADALMIGRAAIGRPWIFEEVRAALDRTEPPSHPIEWYFEVLRRQIDESIAKCGEYRGILHIRRHLAATPLFKGIPDFRTHRVALLRATTRDELLRLLDEIPTKYDISGALLPLRSDKVGTPDAL